HRGSSGSGSMSAPAVRIESVPRTRGYSTAWWGMVVLITTEGMVFLALLSSYFFIRAGAQRWPPAGITPPELHRSVVFSIILLGVDPLASLGTMNLRVRDFPDRGALVWFALTAGIVAWVVHLTVFAALVEFVHDNGFFWFFYVGNIAAVALTLLAGWLSWLLYRAGDDEELGTPAGRMRFLGALGLAVNGINLLLILFEGTYIFFIGTGHA